MSGAAFVLMFLALGVLCWVICAGSLRRRRLQRRVAQAEADVSRAHRQAARAMNRAAGQSYRNLVE